MISLTIRIPDDLHHWLANQAQVYQRSKNKQILYLLERARREYDGPRAEVSSGLMCGNGTHRFIRAEPAHGDFCNCGMFMHGEIKE